MKQALWKAIEAYRHSTSMEQQWRNRDVLSILIDEALSLAELDTAPVQAQPPKPLESKLVDAQLDFDVRGMCAAELLCWHRLTEAESDQLVEFVKIIKEQL